VFRVWS